MTEDEVLSEFRHAGALLEGHFVLSSGLHTPRYLQCARVLMDPARAERLCAELARKVVAVFGEGIDMVASPAMGGVIVGYETGRQLGISAIFFERADGTLSLRRGFAIPPGARCIVVEDIVTTGLSSRECIAAIRDAGGTAVGACCLIDRSGGQAELDTGLVSLAKIDIPTYEPDSLPEALSRLPVDKLGSQNLKS